ncbi:carcinoembryonic antigen-related cell adhesion molecule 3-like [Nycticebus coucang]|uniref:carcinoembryonic antigen-related cell adhesion molecule 3-like n=1 Tax=Nycticebus coucang TaxID=9470 RepID=UPI00234D9428|nr:carcinoembryonic antigen-related cell adhesion molecule 3-like [Nycticebus coucang]
MGPSSVPPCRGCTSWQGLLLTASLLTWNLPTTAHITVESVPPSAPEGADILLLVHNMPLDCYGYIWYRGDVVAHYHLILSYVVATQAVTPGPEYNGREIIYPNASLLLQNVNQDDSGYYTVQVFSQNLQSQEATGVLYVYPSLLTSWNPPTTAQLTVESVPPGAAEGTDVLLLAHNTPLDCYGYTWYKGNKAAHSHLLLSYVVATQASTPGPEYSGRETIYPDGSLLLQNVNQDDSGYYTVHVFSQTLQSEEATGQLRVYRE